MIENIILALCLIAFIASIVWKSRTSPVIYEKAEEGDSPENRGFYAFVSVLLFYPIYYVLHEIMDIKIEHASGLLIWTIVLLIIVPAASGIHKYRLIDKLGHSLDYITMQDLISIVCIEALAMIYFLSLH